MRQIAAECRSESDEGEARGAGDERRVITGTREGPGKAAAGKAQNKYHRRQNGDSKEVEAKLKRAEAWNDEQRF